MIKKTTLVIFLGFALAGAVSAQTLTVKVENIRQLKGTLMVGVSNNEGDFPDVPIEGRQIKITGNVMTLNFSGLPRGSYAVSVYQDLNDNGKLDTNLLGIPKEPYGFSNNASNTPDYKKSLFVFNADLTITVRLK
jgi:uncharacterized protein (DUF2141 family)